MGCTHESHAALKASRVRFVAGTVPAGQWEPEESGYAYEVRRCRDCGSLLSDGTDAAAPRMILLAPPEPVAPGPSVLAQVSEERLRFESSEISQAREGAAMIAGSLVACGVLAMVLTFIAWLVVKLVG